MKKFMIGLSIAVLLVVAVLLVFLLNKEKKPQPTVDIPIVSQEEIDSSVSYFNDTFGTIVVNKVKEYDSINYGSYLTQLEEQLKEIEFSDPDVYLEATGFDLTESLVFRLESLPVISLIITMKNGVTTLQWDTSIEW